MILLTCYVATGWGLDVKTYRCNDYKDMQAVRAELMAFYSRKEMYIEKMIFKYPSGKSFTEDFIKTWNK